MLVTLVGAGCTLNTSTNNNPVINNEPVTVVDTLNLSNQGLTQLPNFVLTKIKLQELNISHNNLTGALPAEIRQLRNLRKLNISYNQMTGLPAEIGQLTDLSELNLSYNRLTGLPYELGNLKNLKTLVLTGNDYSTLDLDVILKSLPNLKVIK